MNNILIIFLLLTTGIILTTISSTGENGTTPDETPNTKKAATIYKQGDTVEIGYTTYIAWQSYWTDRLTDNQYTHTDPDAKYLVIEISVRNDDTKARSIPSFKLIDTQGREYNTSSSAFIFNEHIGILSSLNPDVQKDGFIVFDCPPQRDYKLHVSGGYWTNDHALIQLAPQQSK